MDRDTAIRILQLAAPELQSRYGVEGVRLFGSVARNSADEDSDVDIAVIFAKPDQGAPMRLCGVSGLLSERFGREVDVVAMPPANPSLEVAIQNDGVDAC